VTQDPTRSGLPLAAQARMAEIRRSGTWGSALSADEFAAIRSAGFEPVGQVLGAAVYNVGYQGGYSCPGAWSRGVFGSGPASALTAVSGEGGWGAYSPLVQTMYAARRAAIGRMVAECAALGGHGIVGVSLTIGSFPASANALEFKAIGTAVRGQGAAPPPQPFTSDLSGQDFAKLISAGWVPVGLALGISMGVRHDDWMTWRQTSWRAGNAEVEGYTELVNLARHDARSRLESDVRRLGADGVVVSTNDMRAHARECPQRENARDHVVEVTIIGTATARFADGPAAEPPRSLAILSLDPDRRRAARVRLGD
jgi:uncharacterized protein YbjQ (UPF0145 family)